MKNIFFTSILLALSVNSLAFDSSWISENVHDGCTLIESKAFIYRSEEWDIDATPYGREIGATNGLVDSEEKTQNGTQYNVSYYNCPSDCIKSGATEENGMLGKEYILDLIGYEPIECNASLVVPELLRIDFDNDGFMGYAIRYKTAYGGFQGSQGHLTWNVAFIKNSNGKLSNLNIEKANLGENITSVFYHKLITNKNNVTIQHYAIRASGGYKIIDQNYSLNGTTLIPSS